MNLNKPIHHNRNYNYFIKTSPAKKKKKSLHKVWEKMKVRWNILSIELSFDGLIFGNSVFLYEDCCPKDLENETLLLIFISLKLTEKC